MATCPSLRQPITPVALPPLPHSSDAQIINLLLRAETRRRGKTMRKPSTVVLPPTPWLREEAGSPQDSMAGARRQAYRAGAACRGGGRERGAVSASQRNA